MKRKIPPVLTLSLILSALEIVAYPYPGILSWLASRCWLAHGAFYFFSSIAFIYKTLRQDVREKNFRGLVIFFLFGWMILNIAGSRGIVINHESTQQVADGCAFFKLPDFNYTQTGFFGYPARQYLVVALPSLLLGRSLLALRLGYAGVFLLGIMLFYCGLNRCFSESKTGRTLIAPVITLSLLCFPVVVNIMAACEQTVLPISFTLQAAGWFLLCLKAATPGRLISLAYVGGLLATSYTPGLAPWLLLIVLMGLRVKQDLRLKQFDRMALWLSGAVFVAAIGGASFFTRIDMLARQSGVWVPASVRWPYLVAALREIFIPLFYAFLPLPVVIYVLLSLLKMFRPRDFWISLWAVVTIFLATQLGGLASPAPPYSLHRALVIIPPLLISLALTIEPWLAGQGKISPKILLLALVFGLLIPAKNLREGLNLCRSGIRDKVVYDTLDVVHTYGIDPNGPLRFIVVPENVEYSGLHDCFRYFYPKFEFLWRQDIVLRMGIADVPTLVYLDAESPIVSVMEMLWTRRADLAVVQFSFQEQKVRFLRGVYIPAKK